MVSHFYSWGLGRPAWMNEMDLWAFRQADTVICSARAYREILRRGGVPARRLRLLPWGIATPDRVAPARDAGEVPIIGTVGRVERRKGQLDLVNAFANLRKRWPEAILEIVGPIAEETYASSIRAAITRHRLDASVRLTGHVADPQPLVARWSAYVSLSSDEGQGLAVLEAMANGTTVVALGVAGVEDYLTHARTGLVARTKNAREIAGLIERVLVDRVLAGRLATSARAMVRRRFGWTKTVAGVETAYQRLQRSTRERSTDVRLAS
jgi:glycogen(starch) synthase